MAAKNIYAAVARVLVQTKRFTMLEVDKRYLAEAEKKAETGVEFLESKIIEQGKSLGAQILVFGAVKNAEVRQEGRQAVARIDYEMRFMDVETGKSLAAQAFSGDSKEKVTRLSDKVGGFRTTLGKIVKNEKTKEIAGSVLDDLSNANTESEEGKTIMAIESTMKDVGTWVRGTFHLYLSMKIPEKDNSSEVTDVIIEGGKNMNMQNGCKMQIVLVSEMETADGKIMDEEPLAQLEVVEVRNQTSKCRVLNGGKRIREETANKNMRVIFD